ncbi:MAG: putative lipid II flippase FtsW [Acidobacteriales bacterium]|nr:putative lipid II flippase FtsW [Terriglobales bacterium]
MPMERKTDWVLFTAVVALVFFGLVIMYSASSVVADLKYGHSTYYLVRQAAWAVAAFGILMYLKNQDYRRWNQPVWAFAPMGVAIMLLIVAYFADARAHRWIRLGSAQLQPSELAKPALIVFLAWFVSLRASAINNRKHTLVPATLCLTVLVGMVVAADLGTAVVLLATAGVVFFVAGLDRRHMAIACAAAVLLIAAAILHKPYRALRVIGRYDPDFTLIDSIDRNGTIRAKMQMMPGAKDPGYHARQSKIAVGSGGLLGMGLMQGQQKLLYLPEAHTDFIYAVVGEELGLLGCATVLFMFLLILWRGVRLACVAPEHFGRYLALGVTASIVIQAFMNMSVVLDMTPTKGIPLPMISYGGSSLLSTLASLGLLLSVNEHAG